jgi:hypothetical protein
MEIPEEMSMVVRITCRALFWSVALIAGTAVIAQENTTNGMPNGRFWNILDLNGKAAVLVGVQIGLVVSLQQNDLTERAQTVVERFSLKGNQFEETIRRMDAFYATPKSLDLPLPVAYLDAVAKTMDAATLDSELKETGRRMEKMLRSPEAKKKSK